MGTRRNNLEVFFRRSFMRDAYEGLLAFNSDPKQHYDKRIALTYDFVTRNQNDYTNTRERYKIHARAISPHLTDRELEARFVRTLGDTKNLYVDGISLVPESSVFNLVLGYGMRVLDFRSDEPAVEFNDVLHWQESTLLFGQDLFTCAVNAYRRITKQRVPDSLAWPNILHTNNIDLERMLAQGVAENHFHLWGSASSFDLTWTAMMNRYTKIKLLLKTAGLHEQLGGGVAEWNMEDDNWEAWIQLAAIIRAELFRVGPPRAPRNDIEAVIPSFQELADKTNPIHDAADRHIARLRAEFGVRFYEYDHSRAGSPIYDYAYTPRLAHNTIGMANRAFVGERHILTMCFQHIFSNKKSHFTPRHNQLFYLYLLIKSHFRGEFIQSNNRRGFHNFKLYNDRNGATYVLFPYNPERAHSAINATFENTKYTNEDGVATPYLKTLEARVVPQASSKACAKVLRFAIRSQQKPISTRKMFEAESATEYAAILWNELHPTYLLNKELMERISKQYYFVWHFPKSADGDSIHKSAFSNALAENERNYKARKRARKSSRGLCHLLDEYPLTRMIVRGIDGCTDEIGCRPEVFAPAFRFVAHFIPSRRGNDKFNETENYDFRISRTFHVGEDFLDLADGLRAVDEATFFLHLQSGDRLGHAVALGLSAQEYYARTNNTLSLNKQDMLDTFVWVLQRAPEWNILMPPELRIRLERKVQELAGEIYGKTDDENLFGDETTNKADAQNIATYFRAWHLRGDDPRCYRPIGTLVPNSNDFDMVETETSHHAYVQNVCQKDENARRLYARYHYDVGVLERGRKQDECKVSAAFVHIVSQLQSALRDSCARKRISVECNPTSNKLITPIMRYDNHPIFKLRDRLLASEENVSQLGVSINTDDQGVFATSIYNEYALMYRALALLEDENGSKVHSPHTIRSYLNDVRRMGLEMRFT